MDHSTAGTLRDLPNWRYGRSNCFEARHEELRQDSQLKYWRGVSAFLGFDEQERAIASRCFWRNSLFGGLPRIGNRHVRSGDVAQWKREFTLELARAFLRRFPGALQSLGYEVDDAWLSNLPHVHSSRLFADIKELAVRELLRWRDAGITARKFGRNRRPHTEYSA